MLRGSDAHGNPDYHQREALLRTIKLSTTGLKTNFLVVLTVNKPGEVRPEVSITNGLISIEKNGKEFLINYHPEKALSSKILDQ